MLFVLDANKYSHRGHSKQSSVIVPKRLMNLSKYSHVTKTPHVLFCHRLKYLMCCFEASVQLQTNATSPTTFPLKQSI